MRNEDLQAGTPTLSQTHAHHLHLQVEVEGVHQAMATGTFIQSEKSGL
jgi:hypothetical protein